MIPIATYTTFAELIEYARERARHSAARRAPQDFEYWYSTMDWAKRAGVEDPAEVLQWFQKEIKTNKWLSVSTLAEYHAHCIHCRTMLINRGENPPPLSLQWMRDIAEALQP